MTTPPKETPSAGAMRAARAIQAQIGIPDIVDSLAHVIDRETHVAELVAALEKAEKLIQFCYAAIPFKKEIQDHLPYGLSDEIKNADSSLGIRAVLAKVRTP